MDGHAETDGAGLSRRAMMKLSAGTLLALGVWPGRLCGAESAAGGESTFVVVNDLHFSTAECVPFFEGMVEKINGVEKASHVLIVGDLLDAGTMDQAGAIRDILKKLKAPYHVTPGNHDSATATDRKAFDATFGKEMNTTFEVEGWQFVGLDTSDGVKVEKFDCRAETLAFAATVAEKLDKKKPTVVYTHFPLGPGVRYRLQNADKLLEPLKGLNVQWIFNGHYHGLTEKTVLGGVGVTTNRCCSRKRGNHDGTKEKGFFVCTAAGGKVARAFVEYGSAYVAPASAPAATRAGT
jgi:3',5'-cyclic AMP phosphodiesterase CpdA